MFYKINPKLSQVAFDLGPEGFLAGDRLWIDVKGDFRAAATTGPAAEDIWQNAKFQFLVGSEPTKEFSDPNAFPVIVKAKSTVLLVNNYDSPLIDNSDPDDDYGVLVRLAAFTAGDDVFRFGARTELPQVQGSIYRAGAGDDFVTMPNAPVAGFNHRRFFQAGPGDDTVRAGTLDVRVNFGAGEDRFLERGARVAWATRRTATTIRGSW